jgi:hypothetical protein
LTRKADAFDASSPSLECRSLMNTRAKDPEKKPSKAKNAPAAIADRRLAQQTRRLLAKLYASKSKARPR